MRKINLASARPGKNATNSETATISRFVMLEELTFPGVHECFGILFLVVWAFIAISSGFSGQGILLP
jgi:hypothetical protein